MPVDDLAKLSAGILRVVSAREGVDLAVLFGSFARGDHTPESDVDLLIDGQVMQDVAAKMRLRGQLMEATARPVELLSLHEARGAPEVFAGVLRDGKVVRDVEHRWTSLLEELPATEAAAQRTFETYPERRAAALARLLA